MQPNNVGCALVFAGGLGTRLRTAVPDLPKPMAPVAGQPFLKYLLLHWASKGIKRFVLSVGYRSEAISAYFGRRFEGIDLEYVVETIPLGTGGALLRCADRFEGDFFAINGDTFFDVDVNILASAHQRLNSSWTFALFRSKDSTRYMAVETASNGLIVGLGCPAGDHAFLVNGGTYLISKNLVGSLAAPSLPFSLENDLVPDLLTKGVRMVGVEQLGMFIDIGIPEDYERAEEIIHGRGRDAR